MGNKHKHYDVIVAWAAGEEIQVMFTPSEGWVDTSKPKWHEEFEYRIKPKIVKRVGWVVLPEFADERDRLVTKEIYPTVALAMNEWPFNKLIVRIEWEEEE